MEKAKYQGRKGVVLLLPVVFSFQPYLAAAISHSVVSNSLSPNGWKPARLLCPWNSPGNNTGVGCHSLLQGIFPTQGLNPGFLHCRQILYCLSHQRSRDGQNNATPKNIWVLNSAVCITLNDKRDFAGVMELRFL